MNKSDRERLILHSVYDPLDFDSVIHQDRPDFVLQPKGARSFGVEVTELYWTESDVRLLSVPGYLSSLFAGGAHIHKDDKQALSVSRAGLSYKDGRPAQHVPCIIRRQATTVKYAAALSSCIAKKNTKSDNYDKQLSQLNLIILDLFSGSHLVPASEFITGLFTAEVTRGLEEARYREVFLVSRSKRQETICRRLQLHFIIEKSWLFLNACSQYANNASYTPEQLTRLFADAMTRKGISVTLAVDEQQTIALYQGVGVCYSEEGCVIQDYGDGPTPQGVPTSMTQPVEPSLQRLMDMCDEFSGQHSMRLDFPTAIVRDPWSAVVS